MKSFLVNGVQIGAFNVAEKLADRWLCDNQSEFQFSLVSEDCEIVNYVAPPAETPKVDVISMRQARLQLLSIDLLDDVNAQILAMPRAAQIEWDWASEVERDNSLVLALQTALSMTDSDMDLFFYDAVQL